MNSRKLNFAAPLLAALLVSASPALAQSAPVQATQPVQSISAADKAEGAKAHPQLLEEFGGAFTGPQAAYVESVGKAIAVQSGLSNAKSDFTVTLLNSPVNNAFAIPGGYIYVTRDLVALMNNEAELAGVLGHEVGHVAAQHSKKRQSAAQRNAVIGAIGSILSGVLLGNGALGQVGQSIFSQGSQILTLKYSRGQETEADNLGIEYLRRAGYDPHAMGTVLDSLAKENALDAQAAGQSATRVPEWASTHPADGPRIRAALARAGTLKGNTNRDRFLAGIDGLMVGDDPKQGMVDGRVFVQPDMGFRFEAPQGFYLVNGTRAVSISGQAGKGELSMLPYTGNLEAYVGTAFQGLTEKGQPAVTPANVTRTTINGLNAAYGIARVNSGNSTVDAMVLAYELAPDRAVHFLTVTPSGGTAAFDSMFKSLRKITPAEAAAVKPRRLQVVTVKQGDTLQSLASRMAYSTFQMERFLVINALTSASTLVPGQKVKLVVYGK